MSVFELRVRPAVQLGRGILSYDQVGLIKEADPTKNAIENGAGILHREPSPATNETQLLYRFPRDITSLQAILFAGQTGLIEIIRSPDPIAQIDLEIIEDSDLDLELVTWANRNDLTYRLVTQRRPVYNSLVAGDEWNHMIADRFSVSVLPAGFTTLRGLRLRITESGTPYNASDITWPYYSIVQIVE